MPDAASLDRIRRTLIGLGVAVAVLLLFRALADVLLLVFAAILLASVLHGAAERIGRVLGLRPGMALGVILLAFLVVVAIAVFFRGPVLVDEVVRLSGELGEQTKRLRDMLSGQPWAEHLVAQAQNYLTGGHFAGMLSGVASGTIGALGSLLVLVVAGLYFAASPGLYVEGTIRLLPIPQRERGRAVLLATGHALRWWFVGQAIDMVAVGSLTAIGLFALGIPLAGTLAVIAALFNFVPYIGAICGAVPAVLVAFGHGPQPAIEVALLFTAVQTLEGNVIAPLIQKRTVELPPVLTIFSQTVLGTLFGPLGLILATPLTAAGMVLVRMVYVEDVLGDRHPDVPADARD